jgi:hypothetical protein
MTCERVLDSLVGGDALPDAPRGDPHDRHIITSRWMISGLVLNHLKRLGWVIAER